MLIEAAKGGHTGVVSVLIDYNPNNLSTTTTASAGQASIATSAEVSGEVVSDNVAVNAVNTRYVPHFKALLKVAFSREGLLFRFFIHFASLFRGKTDGMKNKPRMPTFSWNYVTFY